MTSKLQEAVSRTITSVAIIIIAALMTHSMVPLHQLHESSFYGDMGIFVYILAWGAHAIWNSPLDYYNPPIFYPSTNMLPGTDGLELISFTLSPVWLLFKNPILLGNVALFLSHCFALISAYIAARAIFRLPRIHCLLLSAFFAISTDRFWHALGHLNLVYSGILPLIFLAVWKSLETPTWRNFLFLGVALGLSVYLSVYFLVLGGLVAVAAFFIWFVSRFKFPTKFAVAGLAAAIVLGAFIAAPKILIYKAASERGNQTRNTLPEAAQYSATLPGYLEPSPPGTHYTSHWYRVLPKPETRNRTENVQFAGYMLIALLLAETGRLIARILRRKVDSLDRLSLVSLALAGVFVLFSFGPKFTILTISPYQILYYTYLQFSGFYRVPGRLAFIVQWLALLPVAVLFLNLSPRFARLKYSAPVAAAAIALLIIEHSPAERPGQSTTQKPPTLSYLDKLDPSHQEPYVLISSGMQLDAQFCGTDKWRPTVNGWIGSPLGNDYDRRHMQFMDFPTTSALAWMATNRIPWAIVTEDTMKQKANRDTRLAKIDEEGGMTLYKLIAPETIIARDTAQRQNRGNFLNEMRSRTPIDFSWPAIKLLSLVGGDGIKASSSGNPTFETQNSNSISTVFDFAKAIPPGLYDQIEIEYEILDGDSAHSTKLYWRSDKEGMSEKRTLEGIESNLDKEQNRWKTTFSVHTQKDWMQDDVIPRIRFDFYAFDSLKPVTLRIINIEFSRLQETPSIPII